MIGVPAFSSDEIPLQFPLALAGGIRGNSSRETKKKNIRKRAEGSEANVCECATECKGLNH